MEKKTGIEEGGKRIRRVSGKKTRCCVESPPILHLLNHVAPLLLTLGTAALSILLFSDPSSHVVEPL